MTTKESAPVAVTPGEYLLVKRGLYYRPNSMGYTGLKSDAGRYPATDASPDSGVTAIHEDDAPMFAPACWEDVKVKHLLSIISERDRTIAALAQPRAAMGDGVAWRCFHCGDTFTDDRCARLHFGRDEDSTPACIIKAGAEQGLLGALREAEYEARDARQAIANESTESARYHYAQATRHTAALRNAEEAGYERGLADAAALALQSPPAAKVEASKPRVRNRWKYNGLGNMGAYAKAPSISRADGSGFLLSGGTEDEAKTIVRLWNKEPAAQGDADNA